MVLIWRDLVTAEALAQKRPYIIVGAFIIGMLMTPPDAISQTLLAIPIWILFELGLFFGRRVVAKKAKTTSTEVKQNHPVISQEEMDAEIARIEEGGKK